MPLLLRAHFLPAVHDTSDDLVHLLDLDRVPVTHQTDLAQLKRWLAEAGAATRAERAQGLGITARPQGLIDQLAGR